MSRLLFVGLVNFLIALFVPLSPIVATGDNDLDRLVDMVNKFGAEVLPSLQALRNNPYSPSPMRTLGKLVDHLETEFEDVQNESKGHKSATLWAHLGLINDIIYSELNILRYEWYGMNNPYGQIFTQNMVNMDPSSGHVRLNAYLKNQLEMLKEELDTHKQYDDSMANFSEKTDSGRRALHLAFDCVDTLEKMYKMFNMTKHGRHASVSEEELHWALSTLAVNLWAYAAMGTEGGPFVLPGIEEAAKTVEQAHPIAFKMPKRSGVEKAESSDGKNVAGKTGAKHVHDTNKME